MEWSNVPLIGKFFAKNEVVKAEPLNKSNGNLTPKLKGRRLYKFDMDIVDLDMAIARALSPDNPDRVNLIGIYEDLTDLHVKSQIRTAIFKVVSQGWYIINNKMERQKELEDLLKKKWFEDLNKRFVETEFYGHSLIYFWMNPDGEIKSTKLFPRMHVVPNDGEIVPDLNDMHKRVNYRDNPLFDDVFLEIGDPTDLGLLKDVARNSIIKTYGIKDWARSSEKWGDPHVILKSASDDEKENDKKEEWLREFGNNGYAMVDIEDEIELLERKSTGTHLIFKELIELENAENSKGINGQVGSADEKAFVGSAEVQERLLNDYTLARLRSLMLFHTETTFPFLRSLNGGNNAYTGLEGMHFVPKMFMDEEKSTDGTDPNNPDPNNPDPNNSQNPFV